jgi:hypothetical protein
MHFRRASEDRVTLESLGRRLEHLIAEQNAMRDDLPVLTTTGLRLEGAANDQLHAPRAYPRRA